MKSTIVMIALATVAPGACRSAPLMNAKDGQIHKNYNGWIQNLDREIRNELMEL